MMILVRWISTFKKHDTENLQRLSIWQSAVAVDVLQEAAHPAPSTPPLSTSHLERICSLLQSSTTIIPRSLAIRTACQRFKQQQILLDWALSMVTYIKLMALFPMVQRTSSGDKYEISTST